MVTDLNISRHATSMIKQGNNSPLNYDELLSRYILYNLLKYALELLVYLFGLDTVLPRIHGYGFDS